MIYTKQDISAVTKKTIRNLKKDVDEFLIEKKLFRRAITCYL